MNMAFARTLAISSAFSAIACAASSSVLWQADFSDKAIWLAPREYSGTMKFSAEPDTLSVFGAGTNKVDTAWQMETKNLPLRHVGKYALVFTFSSRGLIRTGANMTKSWDSCVLWYDKTGNLIERHQLDLVFAEIPPYEYRFVQVVPTGAEQFKLKLGWDSPNIWGDKSVCFKNLRMEAAEGDAPLGCLKPDVSGPRVRVISETPTRNVKAPVVVSVTDETGVDAASISVSVDGVARTDVKRKAVKDGFELTVPCGGKPWADGLHWLTVKAKDGSGCATEAKKCFLVGERPQTPAVTLRDDGMTLIGGKPFFPIGIYAVCKREFNSYNWDRAVSDLKDAGFNLLHSYNAARDPEFHAAAKKYDMKMWMRAFVPDEAVVEKFRHKPWIIAWYLGDDTASHATANELWDRDDNIRAVDPTRITTQADVYYSVFDQFAPATDNFLPEIYPVSGGNRKQDRCCVAKVKSTMRDCAETQARDPSGRRHSIWPIIQHFKGWGWARFPSPDEFYGMSFAAIVHGAHGITWYTYGGHYNEKKKRYNMGVTSSEKVWSTTTNCTRRIASLVPVLVERTPAQPPTPAILSGPAKDALNGPSITALYKVKDGVKYLLAVNSADAEVKASFAPSASGEVEVLWENRSIPADAKGRFTDTFKPLGVHVYRWR